MRDSGSSVFLSCCFEILTRRDKSFLYEFVSSRFKYFFFLFFFVFS
jgi:hypothetical protein